MEKSTRSLKKRILVGWILFLSLGAFTLDAQAQWVSVMPPEVSANWGLNKVRILSSGGWAVGVDGTSKQGVILQFNNNIWTVADLPDVSSDWELNSFSFRSSMNDVWAVGVDFSSGSRKGIMLHYVSGLWKVITPPYVSLDWGLYDISFSSSNEGWAVGADYSSHKGILLHYKSGVWTSYVPPNLSLDWGLFGIQMISTNEGWAVGVDRTNTRGALLHYAIEAQSKSTIVTKIYTWQVVLPPQINANWELSNIYFIGASQTEGTTAEGWAVGVNHTEKRGAMLRFSNSNWAEIILPTVSSDWELNTVYFSSNTAGWVAGIDHANNQGILLQFYKGLWTISGVPGLSSDWDLASIHLLNANEGWAVGTDSVNKRGVLLKYSNNTDETISTPSTPNGPTNIGPDVVSTFYTGESLSNLDHSVQYFFDWGDGTNSGWLPVGTVGASKSWTSSATYQVKAQARCDTDTAAVSKSSSALSVIVSSTPTPVTLVSPLDGTLYTGCSLYSLPTFTWTGNGSFTGYEIQFSKTESFDKIAASDKTSSTSAAVDSTLWTKVLTAPNSTSTVSSTPVSYGGPVFWRVIGTLADKTTVISNTLSIFIDRPQPVGNLMITNTSASSIPVLSWDNQCNIRFRVWFGNNPNFSRTASATFNIKNPNDNGGAFTDTLTSGQWSSVRQLVQKVTGAPIYWYVESWDGAKRHVISQPPESFFVSD